MPLTLNNCDPSAFKPTFGPATSLPAGVSAHSVVAADVNAFRTQYPTVTNVVGGWTGRLANSDETIELATALGEVVDGVHYASEGDWATRASGAGLGLAICRSLVERMNGAIWVESEEGGGSHFQFTAWFGRSADRRRESKTAGGAAA